MGPDSTTDQTTRSSTVGAAWWAAVLSALAAAGLLAMDVVLFLMDALATGAVAVLNPGLEDVGPTSGDYVEAGVLATVVVLVASQGVVQLGARTGVRGWPPALVGLSAALLAGMLGGTVMLLRLGIDPVDFLTGWI